VDTEDVVQETMRRAFHNLERFVPRRRGAFLNYLCRGVVNQIRDEVRRVAREGVHTELVEDLRDGRPSVIDLLIWEEIQKAYELSLQKLTEKQRDAFAMRIELGLKYEEIAELLGSPSPDAVRRHVTLALVHMAHLMQKRIGPRRDGS